MKKITTLILALSLGVTLFAAGPETLKQHFERGKALFEAGEFAAARFELGKAREALAQSPAIEGSAQAIDYYMAAAAAELREENALNLLEAYIADYPYSIYLGEVHFAMGRLCFDSQDFERAAVEFTAAGLSGLPAGKSAEYNYKLGYSYFTLNNYDRAYGYLRQVGSSTRYSNHTQYCISYIEYIRGNYNAAKEGFSRLAGDPSYQPVVPFYLLQIEYLQNNFRYVAENGERVLGISAGQRTAEIAQITGISHYRLGEYQRSLEYMNLMVERGGTPSRNDNYIIGYDYYSVRRYREAVQYLAKVIGPDDELSQTASYNLGDCYLQLNEKGQAANSFAIAASYSYVPAIEEDALFNYGKLRYELGGGIFNEAINILTRYIDNYPNSVRAPQAREFLAAAYYNSRNYNAAFDAIKAIPNPDNTIRAALQRIAYFRAIDLMQRGELDEAATMLDESMAGRYNPKYIALATFWKGDILLRQGNTAAALPLLRQYQSLAPSTEPEYIMAYYDLGYCYFNDRDGAQAMSAFNSFLSRHTQQDAYRADALNRIGDLHYNGRNFAQATASYESAAAIDSPERHYARYRRAMMFGYGGDNNRKIELLNQIVNAGEGEYLPEAMYELGRTYISLERFTEASNVLNRFTAEHKMSNRYLAALSDLGLISQNLGDHARALACYKQVVESSPSSPEARSAMEMIRGIYVEMNDVGAFFTYAASAGVPTDLSAVQRDSLTFASAERVYLQGDAQRSIAPLRSYLDNFERGAYRAQALYFIGDSYIRTDSPSQAAAALDELSRMYINEYTQRGLERLAPVYENAKDYPNAERVYRQLSETVTSAPVAANALKGYLRNAAAQPEREKGLTAADFVLASRFADREATVKAKFVKAGILDAEGRREEAMRLYAEIAPETRTAEGAEASCRIIENAFERGDYAGAEKMIFDFADRNTPHGYWLGRSFLVLGDIYAGQGDAFQARATFQSIVDGYSPADDGIVAAARERIAAIAD